MKTLGYPWALWATLGAMDYRSGSGLPLGALCYLRDVGLSFDTMEYPWGYWSTLGNSGVTRYSWI